DLGRVGGEGERAGDTVLDGRPGGVLGTADGDLDDAVGLSLGEALQCRGERLGRRDVDGRVRELAALGAVDQLGVDLRGGDGHIGMLLLRERGQGVIRFKSVTSALGPSGTSRPPAASPPTTAASY